jgi:hypothetical protein
MIEAGSDQDYEDPDNYSLGPIKEKITELSPIKSVS